MHIEHFTLGMLETNGFIVSEDKNAVIIDPGGDAYRIKEYLTKHDVTIHAILITHGHGDHIGAVGDLRKLLPEAEVVCHELDAPMLTESSKNLSIHMGYELNVGAPDRLVADGEFLTYGKLTLKVIHVPGHTRGHIVFYHEDGVVFDGDTLFADGIGRWDLPGGNGTQLIRAIKEKLLTLPDDTIVWPGHGPETTIGKERNSNPYMNPSFDPMIIGW